VGADAGRIYGVEGVSDSFEGVAADVVSASGGAAHESLDKA
jgi:hypothetical protein